MALRQLASDGPDAVQIDLLRDQGALVIKSQEGSEVRCLIFGIKDVEEVARILSKGRGEIRYVGPKDLLDQVFLNCPQRLQDLKNKIDCNGLKGLWYYSKIGKLRLPADSVKAVEVAQPPKKKRVLIVDDSQTIQKLLTKIIEGSTNLEIHGVANCPSEAKKIIEESAPDLITLDIHMPEMNGVEFLKTYLRFKRIPTMMISSVSISEGPLVMDALANGASSFIQKPTLNELAEVGPQILEKLESISHNRAISEIKGARTSMKFNSLGGLVAIGSSTGGTHALGLLFQSLPEEIPPIVVVQHLPAVFSKALADRLNSECPFTVKEAENGEKIVKNTIYIAPGGRQMKLIGKGTDRTVVINDDPPVNRFRPSVDYLFNSLAEMKDSNMVAVILTGMGDDGARGMLAMKEQGVMTIAQDEASCVVYGMPKEAFEIGAALKVCSLNKMAEAIVVEHSRKKIRKAS